nr:MAG TPA: hypothetical protein [Caudoviricetes sp.]
MNLSVIKLPCSLFDFPRRRQGFGSRYILAPLLPCGFLPMGK